MKTIKSLNLPKEVKAFVLSLGFKYYLLPKEVDKLEVPFFEVNKNLRKATFLIEIGYIDLYPSILLNSNKLEVYLFTTKEVS